MTQSKGLANRSRDEWAGVLSAALLWLRNEYERAADDPESIQVVVTHKDVLARVDAVLHDIQPTGVDMETFRDWYPS